MLTPEDQERLAGTPLPALERHVLSLLVHGLRTFQAIAASTDTPERLPERAHIEAWVARQAPLADDPAFQAAFVDQLCRLQDPLRLIAARDGQSPLDLPIEALVAWVSAQADARLKRPTPSSAPTVGTPPPPG
ncbi:MAG: hypothetical protein ACK6AD_01395 [Cyanobacteriota bacterium]|jgi:hypothetical protein